ncbi:copper fist DNA binding domain-containing protein [Pilobolus umbonatus]|nr:copper fist DNA binding domain-containing protein [Pilobolus umbonatus]
MLIHGEKWACETCIKGHRATHCQHNDRHLVLIKKKGRPSTQCEKCRELRVVRQLHVKCECEVKKTSIHRKKENVSKITKKRRTDTLRPLAPKLDTPNIPEHRPIAVLRPSSPPTPIMPIGDNSPLQTPTCYTPPLQPSTASCTSFQSSNTSCCTSPLPPNTSCYTPPLQTNSSCCTQPPQPNASCCTPPLQPNDTDPNVSDPSAVKPCCSADMKRSGTPTRSPDTLPIKDTPKKSLTPVDTTNCCIPTLDNTSCCPPIVKWTEEVYVPPPVNCYGPPTKNNQGEMIRVVTCRCGDSCACVGCDAHPSKAMRGEDVYIGRRLSISAFSKPQKISEEQQDTWLFDEDLLI